MASYPSPTTVGAHRWWIRAGEEQLQSWWGASVMKMKEIRRRLCLLAASLLLFLLSLSLSAPSSAAAGTRGRSSPTWLHLSPSYTRTGGAGGEGSRHGQRRRCTVTSTSRDQIWCEECGIMHRRMWMLKHLVLMDHIIGSLFN